MRIVSSKVLGAFLFMSAASAQAATYDVDKSHSSVGFGVKHLVISTVKGSFGDFSGKFDYNDSTKSLTAATGSVTVATINTNDKKRDEHLRGPDFFGLDLKNLNATNNTISFVLTKFEAGKAHGDITIHSKKMPIVLDVEIGGSATDPWGNERAAFDAKGKINRKDFGLNWNKALDNGGLVVGDEVTLEVHVEGIKEKAAAAPLKAAAPSKKKK